jgi:23S rRNA (adenine2030-N6)-methyltransferase
VVNPPFTLEAEMRHLLPALHGVLAEAPASRWTTEWLTGESASA